MQQLDNAAGRRSRLEISIPGPLFDRRARRAGDKAHITSGPPRRRAVCYSKVNAMKKTARDVEGFK